MSFFSKALANTHFILNWTTPGHTRQPRLSCAEDYPTSLQPWSPPFSLSIWGNLGETLDLGLLLTTLLLFGLAYVGTWVLQWYMTVPDKLSGMLRPSSKKIPDLLTDATFGNGDPWSFSPIDPATTAIHWSPLPLTPPLTPLADWDCPPSAPSPIKKQCMGITKQGKRCRKTGKVATVVEEYRCHYHVTA
ncbi:hypothetical protein HRR83_000364 [Exophiala dermatitidis]|uniref:Uncharacterized protein n=1 Tax=Exophiala dermatitidis TaxID=5970 RepID=A0AAN6F2K3_EXODE|nr:hypothetical protein HRR75_000329 [Exophiala dermatitidis]KAJ4527612.1 hypothetical protein HRR74_000366 [Exophiala dermatitidis]KAJ4528248.1 hypothetical protein HRR73_000870 [Exophiala dermatitidis]KAJ4531188.1 hypothetical protein HRR76_008862 [Exophiala dermatitidis]KAJ4536195.1 hypothetical protein HRR78_008634 [Exophiala dermatitidis]